LEVTPLSAGNGKAARVLEQVIEEVREIGGEGFERTQKAVQNADVSEKLDRLLDFVESNAATVAALARRFAGEAEDTARGAGAAVGGAMDSLGDTMHEEVIRPTMRYGRGLRHGLLIGAVLALLFAPWPGNVARARLRAFGREAKDLVDAILEGASAGPEA
jgi:hypothetical protein